VKWDEAAKIEDGVYDFKLVKSSTYYECEECKGKITDGQKTKMLREGEWRATNLKGEPTADAITSTAYMHLGLALEVWR
jgi:hypothetical protein